VHHRRQGAKFFAHQNLGGDAIRRGAYDLDSQKRREGQWSLLEAREEIHSGFLLERSEYSLERH